MPEVDVRQLRSGGFGFQSGVGVRVGFSGRDVPCWLGPDPVVEPVHSFQGGICDSLDTAPGAKTVDDQRLEQAI